MAAQAHEIFTLLQRYTVACVPVLNFPRECGRERWKREAGIFDGIIGKFLQRSDSAKVNAQNYPRLSWLHVSNSHQEATYHRSPPRAEWGCRSMHSAKRCRNFYREDFHWLTKQRAISISTPLTPGAVPAIHTIFPIAWTFAKTHQD